MPDMLEPARELIRAGRLTARTFTRSPAFSAAVLATLAVGIGAPTAIFSVVDAVLLRPLPYPEADRIVQFRIESQTPRGRIAFDALPVTEALDWREHTATLSALAVFNDRALTLATADGPQRLSGIAASAGLFELLGVEPAIGRTPDPAGTGVRQVVLSHATWKMYFAGNRAIVGTSVVLSGEQYEVAAVMPPHFQFPTPEAAFWVPLAIPGDGGRGMLLPAVARLRSDATIPAVIVEGRRMLEDSGRDQTFIVRTMQEQMVGPVRRVLWVLMAAVCLVSVIATANIVLLLLVRGASRGRELSIRLALGAARGQLVRQLFGEGIALAALGGAGGLALCAALLQLLPRLAPAELPRLQEAALHPRVLAFALAVTVGTCLVFCILSVGRIVTIDPIRALGGATGEARLIARGAPRRRLTLLAAGELALTMVLLAGAGLLLRSFVGLVMVPQGFEPRGAMAAQINLPASRYPTPAARLAFHQRLLERLGELRGIEAGGIATSMPNRQPSGRFDYNPTGPRDPDPMTMQIAEVRNVSEGFIEAMGIPLIAGRTFAAGDHAGAEPVMVISEALARLHFPDVDPLGRMLYSGSGNRRVIGVVGNVKPAVEWAQPSPAAYLPIRQDDTVFQWFATVSVVLRGQSPAALAAELRALVLSLDAEVPTFNVRTLSDEVSRLVAGPRFSASILAAFAVAALVLAAVGVYGVTAYLTGLRTREIAVRIAIGATRGQVLRLVLRDGMRVVAIGLAAGLIGSVWLAGALTGLLHDVQPTDPAALASVALVLSSVGLIAAYVPARRATRISTIEALRSE